MDSENRQDSTSSGALPQLPDPPIPSSDAGVIPRIESPPLKPSGPLSPDQDFDVATMEPITAMRILSAVVQALSERTGDIPPTPPVSRPPSMSSLKDLRDEYIRRPTQSRPGTPPSSVPSHDIKAPTFKNVEIGSPEALLSEPIVVEEVAKRNREQYDAIARRFFSKKPPPISIDAYLLRLHRYCPMSTAVYLAAGVYIYKLAIEEKSVPVTGRTVHRLLLASLRVAMKALEDLSYPHARFAGVGGVSEKELAKLEISVCYLTNFELKVDNALLYQKIKALQAISKLGVGTSTAMRLSLPSRARRSVQVG